MCGNNLYVQNLDDLHITRLTMDGSETIINGTSDWVYEEEFDLRNAFRWSPDGKYIAYWQFDTSGVKSFPLVNDTDGLYPKLTYYKYPKVGESNSACRVGIVAASGGTTRWLRTRRPIPATTTSRRWRGRRIRAAWSSSSSTACRTAIASSAAMPRAGQTRAIFSDRDDAWVDVAPKWHWIEKGNRFLWLSERDGWRHVYAVSCSGKTVSLLTPGPYDVIDIAGVDEQRGCVYLIASPDDPTRQYLYTCRSREPRFAVKASRSLRAGLPASRLPRAAGTAAAR